MPLNVPSRTCSGPLPGPHFPSSLPGIPAPRLCGRPHTLGQRPGTPGRPELSSAPPHPRRCMGLIQEPVGCQFLRLSLGSRFLSLRIEPSSSGRPLWVSWDALWVDGLASLGRWASLKSQGDPDGSLLGSTLFVPEG